MPQPPSSPAPADESLLRPQKPTHEAGISDDADADGDVGEDVGFGPFHLLVCAACLLTHIYGVMTFVSGLYINLVAYNCTSGTAVSGHHGFVSGLSVQYQLCDISQAEFTSVCFFAGAIPGAVAAGMFADLVGRSRASVIGLTLSASLNLAAGWAPRLWLHLVARTANGFFLMFAMANQPVYGCEVHPPRHRSKVVGTFGTGAPIGLSLAPLMALAVRQHQWLQAALAAAALPAICLTLLQPESPSWLALKGRWLEAARSRRRMRRLNCGRSCGPAPAPGNEAGDAAGLLLSLRRVCADWRLLLRMLALSAYGFSVSLNFYGFYFVVARVVPNIYVFGVLLGLAELPYPLAFNLLSRRATLMASGLLASLLSLAIAGVAAFSDTGQRMELLTAGLAIAGTFFATVGFNVCYVVPAEIFPTGVRSTCLGVCSSMLRVGGLLAPAAAFVPQLPLRLLLLALPLLLASCCVLVLPDSRASRLPDAFSQIDATTATTSDGDKASKAEAEAAA